jgi:hypothetical protein
VTGKSCKPAQSLVYTKARCGRCGGSVAEPTKKKCFMYPFERGWDWWAVCAECHRGFFGYTPDEAIKRVSATTRQRDKEV